MVRRNYYDMALHTIASILQTSNVVSPSVEVSNETKDKAIDLYAKDCGTEFRRSFGMDITLEEWLAILRTVGRAKCFQVVDF